MTGAHVAEGRLSIEDLCAAVAELSDSGAANLLLKTLGGPKGLTGYVRGIGDVVTRADRYELAANAPHGVLDTTTPQAMAETTAKLVVGNALAAPSRDRLVRWMSNAKPGLARLRAGVPATWRAGDRPGTSPFQTNDVAVLWPPRRAPIVIAAYYEAAAVPPPAREAILRAVGSTVAEWAG